MSSGNNFTFGERCKAARGGMSREEASEKLEEMLNNRYPGEEDLRFSVDKIKRIECGKAKIIDTKDVDLMAEVYREPELRNEYCVSVCSMGKNHVDPISNSGIESLVLQLIAALNAVEREKNQFIEIMSDGIVTESEMEEFEEINGYLKKITHATDGIQLWLERNKSKKTATF